VSENSPRPLKKRTTRRKGGYIFRRGLEKKHWGSVKKGLPQLIRKKKDHSA